MEKPARMPRLVFSLLLSAAAVFGLHLHIVSPYDGRMDENYITPFAWPSSPSCWACSFGRSAAGRRAFTRVGPASRGRGCASS